MRRSSSAFARWNAASIARSSITSKRASKAIGSGDGPSAFSAAAEHYDDARARYSERLIAWALEGYVAAEVVDVGARTGISSRALRGAGARVLAVEPNARMREVFTARNPGIPVLAGRGESLPLDDASVDIVALFECFHWCDAGLALAEARRVLRKEGRLVVVWGEIVGDPEGKAVGMLFEAADAAGLRAARPRQHGSSDVLREIGGNALEEMHPESHERFDRERLYRLFRSLSYAPRDPATAQHVFERFWGSRHHGEIITLTYRFDAFRLPAATLRG